MMPKKQKDEEEEEVTSRSTIGALDAAKNRCHVVALKLGMFLPLLVNKASCV